MDPRLQVVNEVTARKMMKMVNPNYDHEERMRLEKLYWAGDKSVLELTPEDRDEPVRERRSVEKEKGGRGRTPIAKKKNVAPVKGIVIAEPG